jgi:hypothetical protein
MKYAFITSVSSKYLIGTYALLEKLQEFGNKEDVHILWYESGISPDRIEKIFKQNYSFNIVTVPMSTLDQKYPVVLNKGVERGWKCRFLKYKYMSEFENYMWFYIGGDILILTDVTWLFPIGEDHIVLCKNFSYNNFKKIGIHAESDSAVPIIDGPFVSSDVELYKGVWEAGQQESVRKAGRGDMRCLYNTIVSQEKIDKLYLVSYEHWINTLRRVSPVEKIGNEYFYSDGSKIYAVHGPLWSLGYLNKPNRYQGYNFDLFHEYYKEVGRKFGMDERAFK